MSTGLKGLYKFGGAAFVVSGLLFLSRAILDLIAGAPPSSGVEILAWIASNSLIQDFQSEILFFAAGFLAPAVVALYQSLADVRTESGHEERSVREACGVSRIRDGGG